MIYGVLKAQRDGMGSMLGGDPDKIYEGNAVMYDYLQKDPSFAPLVKFVAGAGP